MVLNFWDETVMDISHHQSNKDSKFDFHFVQTKGKSYRNPTQIGFSKTVIYLFM